MASKETFRTFSKLWLVNYCIVIVIITLRPSYALASETKEASKNVTAIETNSTVQTPMAEPLIRFRRQPPRTIIKHIIRPKRYKMKRVKRPKIKYSFAEPPPTYYSRKPIIIKKPTFDSSILEDFAHMNVESADFDLPPSSYEAQSMDLDLYKHYEPSIESVSYKEMHKPSLMTYEEPEISYKEPTFTEVSKSPSYTYSVPEISFKETNKPSVTYTYTAEKPRKPHTKYGAPTEYVYSTGYDKPSDNKYTYAAPATKTIYTEIEKPHFNSHAKNEYSYNKPSKELSRIPATSYGVPDAHIPATATNDYNKYSVVEQKPSYVPTKTETYHFAEPPQPEPSVEITYSPSYEINIPSPHENSYSNGKYHVMPERQPPQRHAPNGYEESDYQEHSKYEEPPQPNHYHPTNDYESQPQDIYEDTPSSHQEVSGTNHPASYQPAPPRHQTVDEFPPSQNLPINANHKQPPYDYPKSSYEVPIYDPVPFDASNHQEREVYPPQANDQSNRHQHPPNINHPSATSPQAEVSTSNTIHSSDTGDQTNNQRPESPINHSRRTRKRKRTRGSSTTVSTTKHILDVPELEEAFEKENRKNNFNSQEPDAHASQRFENVKNENVINDEYSKGPWNPMKIRTSPIVLMATPTSTPTIHTLSTKNKRYHYKQQRSPSTSTSTSTTSTTTEAPPKVEIISIEKSNSKAFYDGVFSTPKIYNINLNRNRYRPQNTSSYATPQTHAKSTNESQFSKRTTKHTFDTTIFKSPINDRDVYRSLPKNHKFI